MFTQHIINTYIYKPFYTYSNKMVDIKHIVERIKFHFTNELKPLTIHTEAIFIDDVWEEIKKKALQNKVCKWYIMTPVNYEYFKILFNTKYSKKQISKIMKERYKWLLEHNQRLELHVHFNKIMNISYKEQENLIKQSIKWFEKELGFKPKEFIPGWWAHNKDTIEILKKYDLKLIKRNQYKEKHDFSWIQR